MLRVDLHTAACFTRSISADDKAVPRSGCEGTSTIATDALTMPSLYLNGRHELG